MDCPHRAMIFILSYPTTDAQMQITQIHDIRHKTVMVSVTQEAIILANGNQQFTKAMADIERGIASIRVKKLDKYTSSNTQRWISDSCASAGDLRCAHYLKTSRERQTQKPEKQRQ